MIVEGYTMDLYCDYAGPHGYKEGEAHNFFGHNKGEAYREAKLDGWRFYRFDGTMMAKCPKCYANKVRKLKYGVED